MNWIDRIRLAIRALRGGAPPSAARDRPLGWSRPESARTGLDALLSDSTILASQLDRAEHRAEEYEETLLRVADDLEYRAEDLQTFADAYIEDDYGATAVSRVGRDLEAYAEMMRRDVDGHRERSGSE